MPQARQLADRLLVAIEHARRWCALDDTRKAVMLQADLSWVVAPIRIVSPQQLSRGSHADVMAWVAYATDNYMHYVRNPTGGLVVPIVWRNHYSVLLLPKDPHQAGDYFDPNHTGARSYQSLDLVDLQATVGRPVQVRAFHRPSSRNHTLIAGGVQDGGVHDVFCAVWILWYMMHGVHTAPGRSMAKPTFATVFRFLQVTVRTFRNDFFQYLLSDCEMSHDDAAGTVSTVLSVSAEMYTNAFYHGTI